MRRMRDLLALVLGMAAIVLSAPAPARSQTPDTPAAPIAVGRVVILAIDGAYWNCISFQNLAAAPITRVRFAFAHVDVFGETRGRVVGERTGTFSPGVPIEGPTPNVITEKTRKNCWAQDIESFSLGRVVVSVLGVTFADGSQWTSPDPTGATVGQAQVSYASLGLPSDMQRIGIDRGRPCHVSVVESPQGSLNAWSYSCASPGAVASDVYYFLNGRLVEHVAA